jgi:hypothetical protein
MAGFNPITEVPDCPYGYYDYPPHNCAPDGYYGPEWFNHGAFIGAGRWFHGSNDFEGQVDNRSIRSTDILAPCQRLGSSQPRSGEPLRNSGETKCAMGAAKYAEKAQVAKPNISRRWLLRT